MVFSLSENHGTNREVSELVWFFKLSLSLFEAAVCSGTTWTIFKTLIGSENAVTITKNETTIVWNDTFDLTALISIDIGVEFTTILTDNNVSSLSANNYSCCVLHPSVANVVKRAFFRVLHVAIVKVIKLTVVNDKLCVLYFEVLVSAWSSNYNGIGVERIKGTHEGHVWGLWERETDINHCLDLR